MKYSEFKLLIRNMRLKIKETQSSIFVKDFYFNTIAIVSKDRLTFNTNFKGFSELSLEEQEFLTHKCMELALTPLKEREDEEQFYYKLRGFGEQRLFLNKFRNNGTLTISDNDDSFRWKARFTREEFDNLPEDIKSHNWEEIKWRKEMNTVKKKIRK